MWFLKSRLCKHVCQRLDFLVYSDKDDKPYAPSHNPCTYKFCGTLKNPLTVSPRCGGLSLSLSWGERLLRGRSNWRYVLLRWPCRELENLNKLVLLFRQSRHGAFLDTNDWYKFVLLFYTNDFRLNSAVLWQNRTYHVMRMSAIPSKAWWLAGCI